MDSQAKRQSGEVLRSRYFQADVCGIVSKISINFRRKMFEALIKLAQPDSKTNILDVGVSCESREDSNFFEKLYQYPHNITAVGTESARFLENDFPGLKFINADGINLPFSDKSFDLAVSFATLEHVGSRDRQRRFIRELCRVGDSVCLTVPNRWYPIEFHTLLPLVHWLPPVYFRAICKFLGKDFFADEKNLNLISERDILTAFPEGVKVHLRRFRLFGLVSNLMVYAKNT